MRRLSSTKPHIELTDHKHKEREWEKQQEGFSKIQDIIYDSITTAITVYI